MEYQVGSVISYQPFGGPPRVVRVQVKEANIKNDRPGFDGVVIHGSEKGMECWGYDYQITHVYAPFELIGELVYDAATDELWRRG